MKWIRAGRFVMSTDGNSDPVVLLTGASSGLGLAIAKRLMRRSYRLVLTARSSSVPRFSEQGIRESNRVKIRPLNVVIDAERRHVIGEIEEQWGGVDVLINNAGVTYRAVVEHVTDSERRAQLDVNFRGPMELVRLCLPGMRKRRSGRILNVSSVGGMMAMPTMAVYSASKFALEGATESLWYEVRPWNIRVSLIQPGFIRSESFERTLYTSLSETSAQRESDPYFQHYRQMTRLIARCMKMARSSPDDVAGVVVKTLRQRNPPLRVAGTLDARLFGLMRRILPRGMYHGVLYHSLPQIRRWGEGREG